MQFISLPTWTSSLDALFITDLGIKQFLCSLQTWRALHTFCKQEAVHLLFTGFDHLNKCTAAYNIHLACLPCL